MKTINELCLQHLGLNAGFTETQLINAVETVYKRKLIYIPLILPRTMFGAWVSHNTLPHEYIVYDSTLPPMHQVFVRLHEVSHFLLGHQTYRISKADDLLQLDWSRVRKRSSDGELHDEQEDQAEKLALYLFGLSNQSQSVEPMSSYVWDIVGK